MANNSSPNNYYVEEILFHVLGKVWLAIIVYENVLPYHPLDVQVPVYSNNLDPLPNNMLFFNDHWKGN